MDTQRNTAYDLFPTMIGISFQLFLPITLICLVITSFACSVSMLQLLWKGLTNYGTLIWLVISAFISLTHKKQWPLLVPYHDWYFFPNHCSPYLLCFLVTIIACSGTMLHLFWVEWTNLNKLIWLLVSVFIDLAKNK